MRRWIRTRCAPPGSAPRPRAEGRVEARASERRRRPRPTLRRPSSASRRRRDADDLVGAAAVALGIPYAALDLDVLEGPAAVRRWSAPSLSPGWVPPPDRLREILERLAVVDYWGRRRSTPAMSRRRSCAPTTRLADILAAGAVPIVFGGDHCVTHTGAPGARRQARRASSASWRSTPDSTWASSLDTRRVRNGRASSSWASSSRRTSSRSASATRPPRPPNVWSQTSSASAVFTVADIDELGIVDRGAGGARGGGDRHRGDVRVDRPRCRRSLRRGRRAARHRTVSAAASSLRAVRVLWPGARRRA